MFNTVISEHAHGVVKALARLNVLHPFYLAGGTGLALQFGHRMSEDFDFFTQDHFVVDPWERILASCGSLVVDDRAQDTLHVRLDGVRVSLWGYPYPLLFPLQVWEGIALADIRDIACMKLSALGDRGSKKDFIDLYVLFCQGLSVQELFALFARKFRGVQYNKEHFMKSFVYFADAEADPMPRMLQPITWDVVKSFFEDVARKEF